MSSSVASWPEYRFLKRQVRWSGIPISQNFPQFIVIHTVKCIVVVHKAEIDGFLELSCFFDDPADVGDLISGSSAFSKSSLNIWNFTVHVLLKPGVEKYKHYFNSMWDECNCAVVWAFFVSPPNQSSLDVCTLACSTIVINCCSTIVIEILSRILYSVLSLGLSVTLLPLSYTLDNQCQPSLQLHPFWLDVTQLLLLRFIVLSLYFYTYVAHLSQVKLPRRPLCSSYSLAQKCQWLDTAQVKLQTL